MFVKILKEIAGATFKVGDVVEVEDSIAKAYIDAGYCEESSAAKSALDASVATELTNLRSGIAEAIKGVVEDVRKSATNATSITPIESEADKTKSFSDCIRQIGLAQKHRDPAAMERLEKVYGAPAVDDQGRVLKDHAGAVGTDGGYLVPQEYATELLKIDPEEAAFADRVRQVPMAGEVKIYPSLRQTGKNAPTGSSAMFAGVQTFYKTEKAQRTKTQAQFDEIELKAVDLTAYTTATRDLLADAPGAESDFLSLLRGALTWRMDHDFLLGDGAGKPLGVFNAPATISVTRNTASKVLYEDIVAMLSKLMPVSWGRARWVANVTTFPQIAALKDGAGNNIFLSHASGGATNAPAGTLLGMPIRWTEKVPVLGTAGDINLFDPSFYLHGLRQGVEVAVSEHVEFENDKIAYRAKIRHDGQPWLKGKFRQADGANTEISPFVQLGPEA